MQKKKVFTRKRVAGALSIVLVVALLLGGTYAWQNFDQHKTNLAKGGQFVDVTLNDSYTPPDRWIEGQTLDKEVSVTNPENSTDPIYVRLQFKEYFEKYNMDLVTDGGSLPVLFATYADGPNKGDFMTWADAQAGGYDYIKYTVTYADGTKADFARTQDAEIRDGIYGKEMYIQSELKVYGDPAPEKADYPNQDHDLQSADNLECQYPVHIWGDDGCQIGYAPDGDTIHDYISWALNDAKVMTMTEWKAADMPTGDFWVLDTTDGWAYWANPIQPGQSTENIMESIKLDHMPGSQFEYYIHIDQQAVTLNDLGLFESDGGGVSPDGQLLLDALALNIAISPNPAPVMNPGDSQQFTATVTGLYNPGQDVTWSVSGNTDPTTAIDEDGNLVLGPYEQGPVTVIATSKDYPDKSGSIDVTVDLGGFQFVIDTSYGVSSATFGSSPQNIILQVVANAANDYTVYWGDGEYDDYTNAIQPSHTYADDGTYTIAITGDMPGGIGFGVMGPNWSETRLTKLLTPLLWMDKTTDSYTFCYCKNLTDIPADLFYNNPQITSFTGTFSNCSGLTSIPADLFANNTQVISFGGTFQSCTSLTSIPTELFANNTQVTIFNSTFANCTSLTSIPENLFANNTLVINFYSICNNCTSLTSIPSNLFANNTQVADFSCAFYRCTGLKSIPSNLFASNTQATAFDGTFSNCSGLTSIPAGLFANNTQVTTFGSTFYSCTGITSIPANLFANNTEATNFPSTFAGCTIMSIPADLFANNTQATNFYSTFSGCLSLTSIPSGLFEHNTEVTNFSNTFYQCAGLTSIPANLFDNNTQVTSFNSTFGACRYINTAIPAWWDTTLWPTATYPQFGAQSDKTLMFFNTVDAPNYASVPAGWK